MGGGRLIGVGRLIEVGVPWIFFHYRVINFLVNMESIAGFHMTSLKFKLQNYWSSWHFSSMMYKSSWKLIFIQIFAPNGFLVLWQTDAWISELLRDAAFTWRPRELSCWLKMWLNSGNLAIRTILILEKSIILMFLNSSRDNFTLL